MRSGMLDVSAERLYGGPLPAMCTRRTVSLRCLASAAHSYSTGARHWMLPMCRGSITDGVRVGRQRRVRGPLRELVQFEFGHRIHIHSVQLHTGTPVQVRTDVHSGAC